MLAAACRGALLFAAVLCSGADEPIAPAAPKADSDDAYQAAKELFDDFAPPEVKEQYEFPSREQFDAFAVALQATLDGDSIEALAKREPEARAALAFLKQSPQYEEYADWLAPRLDEAHVARSIVEVERAHPAPPGAAPSAPGGNPSIPYFGLWFRRLSARPPPADAAALMPRLRAAFAAEGVPPELAWLAEVESSLNPNAHNPSGATGLYQLKAETAKGLGLSTFLPDERTDPIKSAHAAARLLKALKERFGTWPLAIAAYNAGEGRVSRALASRKASTYAGVASSLPAGTRIYVPEVCALVAIRTGRTLE